MAQPPPQPFDDGPDAAPRDAGSVRQLVLIKEDQRYLFRYGEGDEPRMLQALIDLVHDPGSELDWFDAAVLSHQMGQRLSDQLNQLLKH